MARSPQPLKRVIATDATLAAWRDRRAREEALCAAVRRLLPRQLGERIRAAPLESGEIELLATAGAIAAAVRQRAPEVAEGLRREGWPCTALRVRVQVAVGASAGPKPEPRQLDRASLAPLAGLARSLPPGPLKIALARFLRRSGA